MSVRRKLGESLSSVQKYATPLEEATTPSLEALKAYSLATEDGGFERGQRRAALLQTGGRTRPEFRPSLRGHGGCLQQSQRSRARSAENARKAYGLREKVSERGAVRHRRQATTLHATGELEKVAEVYEQWLQTYPREFVAHATWDSFPASLGNWEKALEETREELRLRAK